MELTSPVARAAAVIIASSGVVLTVLGFVYKMVENANGCRRTWADLRGRSTSSDVDRRLIEAQARQENLDFHSWYGSWFYINTTIDFLMIAGLAWLAWAWWQGVVTDMAVVAVFGLPLVVGAITAFIAHRFTSWTYRHELTHVFGDDRRHYPHLAGFLCQRSERLVRLLERFPLVLSPKFWSEPVPLPPPKQKAS